MKITVGIPCYRDVSAETLDDYMRFMFYLGRNTPHDYFLAIKSKTEQFRARNAIVEAALQIDSDYLLFLDDDHVIDWEGVSGPNSRYGFITTLLRHMEADPKLGLVGVVYYHRGGQCRPVLMKEGKDGGYYWMRDDEIKGGLQQVAVQGGGCMLLRMSMFDKIKAPYFEPEFDYGTDIQICRKARDAGFKTACDTSIKIGHVLSKREVVTPQNRNRIAFDNAEQIAEGDEGIDKAWKLNTALALYRNDAEQYLGCSIKEMGELANSYTMGKVPDNVEELKNYYRAKGKDQIARQVLFHHTPGMIQQMEFFQKMVNSNSDAYGCDIGCGSAPVTFEFAMRGHKFDFIDIDGAGAYEFLKWRVKTHEIEDRCGFILKGPYDYIFMLDSIEHIKDWAEVLTNAMSHLKEKGAFITNYFLNEDYDNPEHISMDKEAVKAHLVSLGVYPINEILWQKNPALNIKEKIA